MEKMTDDEKKAFEDFLIGNGIDFRSKAFTDKHRDIVKHSFLEGYRATIRKAYGEGV